MPHSQKSTNQRLAIALALFVGGVFAGVLGLTQSGRSKSQAQAVDATPPPTDGQTTVSVSATAVFNKRMRDHSVPTVIREPTKDQTSFTLEIDFTNKREDAERLIANLRQRGIDAYYTPFSRSGKIIYRVRHGIYSSRAAAKTAQVAIQTEGKILSRIVKLQ